MGPPTQGRGGVWVLAPPVFSLCLSLRLGTSLQVTNTFESSKTAPSPTLTQRDEATSKKGPWHLAPSPQGPWSFCLLLGLEDDSQPLVQAPLSLRMS
jgi:hypothetical protein